jgi:hypothetical protein
MSGLSVDRLGWRRVGGRFCQMKNAVHLFAKIVD